MKERPGWILHVREIIQTGDTLEGGGPVDCDDGRACCRDQEQVMRA